MLKDVYNVTHFCCYSKYGLRAQNSKMRGRYQRRNLICPWASQVGVLGRWATYNT